MRRAWVAPIALASALVFGACGGGPAPAAGPERLTFTAPSQRGAVGTLTLEGRAWGRGDVVVVFAHMFPSSQDAWASFAEDVAGRGFAAMTFNFRGYGLSQGDRDPAAADLDLEAALTEARRRGARTIFLVGASMGGTASFKVAAGQAVAGVAALSAPVEFRGLDASAEAARVRAPVLLVAARGDGEAAEQAGALARSVGPSARVEIVEGAAHGTDLLQDARAGERVRDLILGFLLGNRG